MNEVMNYGTKWHTLHWGLVRGYVNMLLGLFVEEEAN
jgi:hypothetical protein